MKENDYYMLIYSENLNCITNIVESITVSMDSKEDFSIKFESSFTSNTNEKNLNLSIVLMKEKHPRKTKLIDIIIFRNDIEILDVYTIILRELVIRLHNILKEKNEININNELYETYIYLCGERITDFYDFDVEEELGKKLILEKN
jgi:hypothetical protein